MKHTVEKIRALLDELESDDPADASSFRESFQLFELPEIVGNIVDFLQPSLEPHQAALYWYMFRHSVIANGDVFVRFSTRGVQEGVINSSRPSQSNALSLQSVQTALRGLVSKGAISVAGDTNRDGTPYRVHLPEEIQLCRDAMAAARSAVPLAVAPERELDFYNIKENRLKVFERDGYLCRHCGKQLTRFSATLDHVQPVSQGGNNSYSNLATACLQCNSQRGAQPIMDFLTRRKDE